MSSHFLFHSEASETVPANARYAFPTQASRVIKSQVKVPPRTGINYDNNGASSKGKLIQIVIPAQGYLNPLESYLRFDLTLIAASVTGLVGVRPIDCIHSMFRRMRILYGSLVIEDIQNYATLVRMLTNVAVNTNYQDHQGCILEGMGSDAQRAALHNYYYTSGEGVGQSQSAVAGAVNFSPLGTQTAQWGIGTGIASGQGSLGASGTSLTHTYCINLASGFLTQQKLIPLKWMANQLTIELELEEPAGFIVQGYTASTGSGNGSFSADHVPGFYNTAGDDPGQHGSTFTYNLDNVYYVAELLEFDSTYDAAFYQGMLTGGVPIKFASWHNYIHAMSGGTKQNLVIQERSRSIKAAFSVIRDTLDLNSSYYMTDPLWFYAGSIYDCQAVPNATPGALLLSNVNNKTDLNPTRATQWIQEFQWRIGGRYFPSQPVRTDNGGAEALAELQKALNSLGDYSVSSPISIQNWWRNRGCFTMSAEFESSNGTEMSGVNAEELADLALSISWATQSGGTGVSSSALLYSFIHYDAMLIIRPNNVIELVA